MRAQSAHMQPCSHQRALCGVTKGLHVKSYAGDGVGPVSGQKHYLTSITLNTQMHQEPEGVTSRPSHYWAEVHCFCDF